MDPIQVMKTVWRHRMLAIPVILLTFVGVVYATLWGPRSYDSTVSYVFVGPRAPTSQEIAADPTLADASSANPYLRATNDPSLAAQVVIAKLNSAATAKGLSDQGIDPQYSALPGSGTGGSAIITITATAAKPRQSLQEMTFLGNQLVSQLKEVQTSNGADERYLISAIQIDASISPVEKVSSRLRTIVVVAAGGLVLLFGVMSIAQARENTRRRRHTGTTEPPTPIPTLAPIPSLAPTLGLAPTMGPSPIPSPPASQSLKPVPSIADSFGSSPAFSPPSSTQSLQPVLSLRSQSSPRTATGDDSPAPRSSETQAEQTKAPRHAAVALDSCADTPEQPLQGGISDAIAFRPPARAPRLGLRRAVGEDLRQG